jgi:hypothetical protein
MQSQVHVLTHTEKKNHFHSTHSINIPITTHPNVPPTGAPNPNNPTVKFLMRPGGKVIPLMATTFGITSAAPMPLIALAMEKDMMLEVQKPYMRDQRIHHPPPNRMFL